MNELEVAYFTVLLDKIEYDSINIEQWIFLTFVVEMERIMVNRISTDRFINISSLSINEKLCHFLPQVCAMCPQKL